MNIILEQFPSSQFVNETTTKRQIVLHHTASGPSVSGDIAWWKKTPERVATHFIIDREGQVHQLFSERNWAYHLGLTNKNFTDFGQTYKQLDKQSIGIEIDSWGPLQKGTDGKYYPIGKAGKTQPVTRITEYCNSNRFKGYTTWESYTPKQIESLRDLLRELCSRHNIPKTYNPSMWAVLPDALRGTPGIFTHLSYRRDKLDCHPQPELIAMLKTL